MEQTKYHRTKRHPIRPAVCRHPGRHRFRLSGRAACSGNHHQQRKNQLVRRTGKEKGQQDRPTHPEKPSDRFQCHGHCLQQGAFSRPHVRKRPDYRPCRGRNHCCAPQHRPDTLRPRPQDHHPQSRAPVGRQLHHKAALLPAKYRPAKRPARRHCHPNRQQQTSRQTDRRLQRPAPPGKQIASQGDEQRKPPVARRQRVCDHRNPALPPASNNPAPHHPRRVAPQAHADRQRLPATPSDAGQRGIQQIGRPRKISDFLHPRKQRKENTHRRQHHGNDLRRRSNHPVQQQPAERLWPLRAPPCPPKRITDRAKPRLQPPREYICPRNGQPQYSKQQRRHHQWPAKPSCQHPVNPLRLVLYPAVLHAAPRDLLRPRNQPLHIALCLARRSGTRQTKPLGPRTFKAVANRPDPLAQRLQPLSTRRRNSHNRHPQLRLQLPQRDCDARRRSLIHQIHAEQNALRPLHHLKRQQQTALQIRRIADSQHTRALVALQIFGRNLLFRRAGLEGIKSRQIRQRIRLRLVNIPPLCQRYSLSRPVSGVLSLTGQRVKQRALPDVWIPHQRNPPRAVLPRSQPHGPVKIFAASLFRIAITAPRTK